MRSKNEDYMRLLIDTIERVQEETKGSTPTREQLAAMTHTSIATVSRYLKHLQQEGLIQMSGHRNIVIQKDVAECRSMVSIPVSFTGPGEFVFIKATGNEAADDGIEDGDLVLIRKQSRAEQGQLVCIRSLDGHPMWQRYDGKCEIYGVAVKVIRDLC